MLLAKIMPQNRLTFPICLPQSSDTGSDDPLSAEGLTWNGENPDTFPLETAYTPYTVSADKGDTLEFDLPAYSTAGLVIY